MRLYMCLRVVLESLWLERRAFGRKAQSPPFGLQAGVGTAFPMFILTLELRHITFPVAGLLLG